MKAVLICYTLKDAKHDVRSAFKREFLGYTDKSNNGVYKYKRDGLLDKIPHIKPINGAVIVKENDKRKVKSLLKKYKAKVKSFDISLKRSMLH